MEGLGASMDIPSLYQKAGEVFLLPISQSYEMDRYVTGMGASGMRLPVNFEVLSESGVYDWSLNSGEFKMVRELIKRGCRDFIITCWSPPAFMKDTKLATGGGKLLPQYYDAFAAFLVQYCKGFKDSTGVEPWGVSPQVEPAFAEPYPSCVYTQEELNQVITLLGEKLKTSGLQTRLGGPEDMDQNRDNWPLVKANPYLYAFTVQVGASVTGHAHSWMVEWDQNPSGLPFKAMNVINGAQKLQGALTNGYSWFTWFTYSNNCGWYNVDTALGAPLTWVPNGFYFATRAFAKFAPAGAVRVGCTNDAGVTATAFKLPDGNVSVIMVNAGTSAATTSVTGAGLPTSWHMYVTTEANANAGTWYSGTSNGTGISVPAKGIVSLISGNKVTELGADTISRAIGAPQPSNTIGELNLHGDDTVEIYINGTQVPSPKGFESRNVSVLKGENVIAVKLINQQWGGGLIAAMLLPGGDTLRTDGTWKLTIKPPAGGWTSLAFDDAQWEPAHDMGPVTIWPGFAKFGLSAVNYYGWKAHWISGALKTYFRKTLNVLNYPIQYSGNNMKFKVYFDGTQFGAEHTDFAKCDQPCQIPVGARAGNIQGFPTGNHTVAFEVEDVSADGNGVLLKTWQATGPGKYTLFIDTTWKCWTKLETGWNTATFNDANWANPGKVWAYDATSATVANAPFIYPNTFWYRKKFTSKEATNIRLVFHSLKNVLKQQTVERYNMRGQKITGPMIHGSGVVLLRTADAKGTSLQLTKKVEKH